MKTNNGNGDSFLPNDYTAPKSAGNYMKLQDGENKFRILSKPVIGWLDWEDNKPLRFTMQNKPAKPVDPKRNVKHFWAFCVWDYADSKVKILEVTQTTIQQAITSLSRDEDWGSPFDYDIKIIKSGKMLETEYSVNPVPHKKISAEVQAAVNDLTINLDALFSGSDPFEAPVKATEKQPF